MKKQDLIREIAQEMKIDRQEVSELLDTTVDELTNLLGKGKSLLVYKFGTFSVSKLEKRKGYNPLLQKWMMLPPKLRAHFKPGDSLKKRVNKEARKEGPDER